MASMAAREAEMLEPWRKNFPICKPYASHDKADAVRFLRELEEGWASTPHAKAAYIPLRGGGIYRYMGHYVFMCLAPSFLPSRAGAVTRIY